MVKRHLYLSGLGTCSHPWAATKQRQCQGSFTQHTARHTMSRRTGNCSSRTILSITTCLRCTLPCATFQPWTSTGATKVRACTWVLPRTRSRRAAQRSTQAGCHRSRCSMIRRGRRLIIWRSSRIHSSLCTPTRSFASCLPPPPQQPPSSTQRCSHMLARSAHPTLSRSWTRLWHFGMLLIQKISKSVSKCSSELRRQSTTVAVSRSALRSQCTASRIWLWIRCSILNPRATVFPRVTTTPGLSNSLHE
mmetsp:Transcript_56714/g.93801  ORF Transcript_56714/g.93801 Transcript_56714/m.93801 type:complete len:249 (-) Transcript_56714:365-1111(-)